MVNLLPQDASVASRTYSSAPTGRCSVLHGLEPLGVGTSECESAYSYVHRLAVSHQISLYKLVKFVCQPVPGVFTDEIVCPFRLDSQCPNASAFLTRLSILTGQPAVRMVGLSWLQGRAAANELVKKFVPWCPGCLRHARDHGHIVYGRAAWLFRSNHRCSVHDLPLAQSCPQCGASKSPSTSTRAVALEECAACGHDLAQLGDCSVDSDSESSAAASLRDRWVAEQLATLFEHAPQIAAQPSMPVDLQRIAESAIERGLARSVSAFCSTAGIARYVTVFGGKPTTLPTVDLLLRLSIAADVSVAGVLCPALWQEGMKGASLTEIKQARRTRPLRRHDWPAIEDRVRSAIERDEPLSIAVLAEELQMQQAALLARLGDLGHRLTRHSKATRAKEVEALADSLVERIDELHKTHSYFGRRLSKAQAALALSIPRWSEALRLAWTKFEQQGPCRGGSMELLFDETPVFH